MGSGVGEGGTARAGVGDGGGARARGGVERSDAASGVHHARVLRVFARAELLQVLLQA